MRAARGGGTGAGAKRLMAGGAGSFLQTDLYGGVRRIRDGRGARRARMCSSAPVRGGAGRKAPGSATPRASVDRSRCGGMMMTARGAEVKRTEGRVSAESRAKARERVRRARTREIGRGHRSGPVPRASVAGGGLRAAGDGRRSGRGVRRDDAGDHAEAASARRRRGPRAAIRARSSATGAASVSSGPSFAIRSVARAAFSASGSCADSRRSSSAASQPRAATRASRSARGTSTKTTASHSRSRPTSRRSGASMTKPGAVSGAAAKAARRRA